MDRHDPLPIIIDTLMAMNAFPEEVDLPTVLQATQEHVQKLRLAFRDIPCHVDYSDRYVRGAYMLAYFPYYIEPVHTVLSRIRLAGTNPIPNKRQISVCVFGSGPTPEALGVMAYLQQRCPTCTQAHFSLLDAAADGWQRCTGLCFDQLQPHYWDGEATHSLHECNLLSQCNQCGTNCTAQLQNADLVILQNCLNDIIVDRNAVVGKAISIFRRMRPGAIFICIDLNFDEIRRALQAVSEQVTAAGLGTVLHPVAEAHHEISRSFDIPPAMLEHLYIGDDGLRPRRYTRFYALALQKV